MTAHPKKSPAWNLSVFFLSVTLLVYTFVIGIKNIFRYNDFRAEYQRNLQVRAEERARNRYYKIQLNVIEDHRFWEMKAREELGYVKNGETVYKFME